MSMDAVETHVEVLWAGEEARLVVSGDLDLATVGLLRAALDAEAETARNVLVDISAARLGDATPLGALAQARIHVEALGRRFEVVGHRLAAAGV